VDGNDNDHFSFIGGPNGVETLTVAQRCPAELKALVETACEFASASTAASTRRAYTSDWRSFCSWCSGFGFETLPASPETVALYVTTLASSGRRPSTIARALASISVVHSMAGHESPTASARVKLTMKGLRRRLGVAQAQKSPLVASQLRTVLSAIPDGLSGARDRALLLTGFSGGFRRSEIVNLNAEDLSFTADGLVITVKKSKTDQEGRGRTVGIPYGSTPGSCPVRALRRWLDQAGITKGPVFRAVGRWGRVGERRLSDQVVARIIKKHVAALGLDADQYAGHSLRSGLATSAAAAGKSERAIMDQTGHRSVTMVRKYIRSGSLFHDNAAAGLL